MIENLDNEAWKDIEGYEGLYQVSNYGRVKSLNYHRTNEERLLKPLNNGKGYLLVCLWKDGKRKPHQVHRLIAKAFLPNPDNLLEVNHRDENPLNNCANNLEWCDRKYNCNYGTRNQRRVEKTSKQVYQYDKELNLIKIWNSTAECDRNGFNHGAISSCCNGKLKSYKGYIWSYTNNI